MDLTQIENKRKFLANFFANKAKAALPKLEYKFQETTTEKQNKYNVKIDTWKDLMFASSDINPKITPVSFYQNLYGFLVADDLGQAILERALYLVAQSFINELDVYDYEVYESLQNYIIVNELHKKSLHNLVKNLKNLQPEDLLE